MVSMPDSPCRAASFYVLTSTLRTVAIGGGGWIPFVWDVVMIFFFLIIILSATHCRAAADFALRGKTEGALPAPDAAITRRAFNHPHQH